MFDPVKRKIEKFVEEITTNKIVKHISQELSESARTAREIKSDMVSLKNHVNFLFDKEQQKSKILEWSHFGLTAGLFLYVIFLR